MTASANLAWCGLVRHGRDLSRQDAHTIVRAIVTSRTYDAAAAVRALVEFRACPMFVLSAGYLAKTIAKYCLEVRSIGILGPPRWSVDIDAPEWLHDAIVDAIMAMPTDQFLRYVVPHMIRATSSCHEGLLGARRATVVLREAEAERDTATGEPTYLLSPEEYALAERFRDAHRHVEPAWRSRR